MFKIPTTGHLPTPVTDVSISFLYLYNVEIHSEETMLDADGRPVATDTLAHVLLDVVAGESLG